MVQFRPAAERGQYDPLLLKIFPKLRLRTCRGWLNYKQTLINTDRALQQEVQNAKRTTQNDAALQSLATFSKTAAKYVQDNAKQTLQDIQDGED